MTGNQMGVTGLVARIMAQPWVRYDPGRDTWMALATLLYFIPSYYLGANTDSPLASANFVFATTIVLVILPAYYVLWVMKKPISEMGFTTRRLLSSLGITALLIMAYAPRLRWALGSIPEANALPHLIYCGLCLWEPFFIHSWIQMRFDKAFGIIPGVIAAGACTAAYHVGTFPAGMVAMLGIYGLLYGVIFRATRNIFALWPLAWAGAAAMGTIQGGFVFDWHHVALYGAVLLAQIVSIGYLSLSRRG